MKELLDKYIFLDNYLDKYISVLTNTQTKIWVG